MYTTTKQEVSTTGHFYDNPFQCSDLLRFSSLLSFYQCQQDIVTKSFDSAKERKKDGHAAIIIIALRRADVLESPFSLTPCYLPHNTNSALTPNPSLRPPIDPPLYPGTYYLLNPVCPTAPIPKAPAWA